MCRRRLAPAAEHLIHGKGLDRRELCRVFLEQIGITRATVIAIEKGNYNPSLELAFRLARFFGKGVEEIFSPEEVA